MTALRRGFSPHTFLCGQALNLEETMRTRMQGISYEEFEGVLHPAFEEDEIELIALGGLLGLTVGIIQLFTLFA